MTSDRLYATLNTKFPSAKLKFIAVAIAARANEEGKCYPGYKRIASNTHYKKRSAIQAVNWLEEVGFLEKEVGGGSRTNTYTLRRAIKGEGEQWHFEGWGFEVPVNPMHQCPPCTGEGGSPVNPIHHPVHGIHPPSEPDAPVPVKGIHPPVHGLHPNDSGNDSSNDSLNGSATTQATESQSPPQTQSSEQVKEPEKPPDDFPGKKSDSKYLWNKWKGQGDMEGFAEIEIRYAILYLLRYKPRNDWYVTNLTDFGFIRRNIKKMMDDTPPGWRPSDAQASGTGAAATTPDPKPLWDRMEMARQAVSNLGVAQAYFKQHQTEYEHNPNWGEWKKDFEWRKIL